MIILSPTSLDPVLLPIQGVLSLTFAQEAAKPSKDKESMYSSRPEIEVLLYVYLVRCLFHH